jgi:arginine decarboxylase
VKKPWTLQDSLDLYNIPNWGGGHFGISAAGHLTIQPQGAAGPRLSLKVLADDLRARGIQLPALVRCSDLLRARIETLNEAFLTAIRDHEYQGSYRGVYPIKVNQQRTVVGEILRYGRPYHYGLEAGSKPELLAVVAVHDDPDALIVCNGHKDAEYVDFALLSSRLGRKIIIVVEKLPELTLVLERARHLGVRPSLGFRTKLGARGAGRWEASSGDRSKFGLTAADMETGLQMLRRAESLDTLELLHFHIGSQITDIRQFKVALSEASRFYVELCRAGAPMGFMDVGGGLGIDYDGSRTNFKASVNYTLQEYANDVVFAVQQACSEAELPMPTLVSESGRAVTAHHSVLLFEVTDVTRQQVDGLPADLPEDCPTVLSNLREVHDSVSRKNFQEAFHDVQQAREEVLTLFNHGILSLHERAIAEKYAWATFHKILPLVRELEYVPDELQGLERILADTYYCNFSCFQSIPDSWAVGQLFPIVPLQRLQEEPRRRGILADITCDSDGKVDRFIDLRDVKDVLELHEVKPGDDYLIGAFLVGAYQEILGDLHNLFGDINAVHVRVTDDGGYVLDHVVEGDTVAEVLQYVEFNVEDLTRQMRQTVEAGVRDGRVTLEQSKQLLQLFKGGLDGYTYLES